MLIFTSLRQSSLAPTIRAGRRVSEGWRSVQRFYAA